ncbi:phytoene/squalene synthase family protein [Mobilicoccus caccae]|uniref:Phytoene synthase n=1 Tax=Mobilicoccus caccae TaxID=1859295 RepID=A0ABQ6IVW9_9MICO|nr:phytoene/squalene synthase family protein [Mobilicoccus caccae]GMA42080.1 phytoene synthase [Mobilicoccus caccae]
MSRPLTSDVIAEGDRRAAALTRQHGTTYYWGTRLLRPEQRRDVFTVYALCRLADDIVDEPEGGDLAATARRLADFRARFVTAVESAQVEVGTDPEAPVLAAVARTVRERGIPLECFDRFFDAMTLDLTRTSWASWPELRDDYMEGSAAVIGEMMLPILDPLTPEATEPARALGLAFQLTNFIRDVGEDLERGRIYLPADEMAAHGADARTRVVTPQWRAFLAAQIARNRELYARARPGVTMLPRESALCVALALRMYAEILERIEAADYDVFTARRRVPRRRKVVLLLDTVARGPRTALKEKR